jgi:hypothetical protein
MQWERFETTYELPGIRKLAKRAGLKDWRQFYDRYIADGPPHDTLEANGPLANPDPYANRLETCLREMCWYRANRPFYRVYPCIIEMAKALKPDTPVHWDEFKDVPMCDIAGEKDRETVRLQQTLCLDTPKDCGVPPVLVTYYVRGDGQMRCVLVWNDSDQENVSMTLAFDKDGGILGDIDQLFTDSGFDPIIGRLVSLLHMLSDPACNLIERMVLKRDEGKPVTATVLDRAERLQGLGWSIGKDLEKLPRRSRPHWGIRWCKPDHEGQVVPNWDGKAPDSRPGCVPKLRPIKGSNQDLYSQVPTGYLDSSEG